VRDGESGAAAEAGLTLGPRRHKARAGGGAIHHPPDGLADGFMSVHEKGSVRMDPEPTTELRYSRYSTREVDDGSLVVYDEHNDDAWVRSDVTVESMR
jgi:hypothetical protein